jgi:hypothetical protein
MPKQLQLRAAFNFHRLANSMRISANEDTHWCYTVRSRIDINIYVVLPRTFISLMRLFVLRNAHAARDLILIRFCASSNVSLKPQRGSRGSGGTPAELIIRKTRLSPAPSIAPSPRTRKLPIIVIIFSRIIMSVCDRQV